MPERRAQYSGGLDKIAHQALTSCSPYGFGVKLHAPMWTVSAAQSHDSAVVRAGQHLKRGVTVGLKCDIQGVVPNPPHG